MAQSNTHSSRDPVLRIAMVLIRIMQIFTILGVAALAVGSVLVLVFQDKLLAEIASSYPDISASFPYLLAAFLLGMILLLGLFWLQLSRLRAIVGTVDDGQPFARINGERLRFIAILILLQQFAVLMIVPVIAGMQSAAGRYAGSDIDEFRTIDFEISLTALLVALLLIILGRVFEQGADMQEELEGTV